ncbi:hypothetical protein D9M71_826320 [compost metagenome]
MPCLVGLSAVSFGVPLVTKVSTRPTDCDTFRFLAFFGTSLAKVAAVPRQRLGLPSSSQVADRPLLTVARR